METRSATKCAVSGKQLTDRAASLASMRGLSEGVGTQAHPGYGRLAEMHATLHSGPRTAQLKAVAQALNATSAHLEPLQARANATGLPDSLKDGVEALSGVAMDEVRVHYGSAEPAALQAHAFARGTDIHVAPGQEAHLPHEAWHVVQQAQGRVRPTMQLKDGVPVNDEARLEREADVMGARAARGAAVGPVPNSPPSSAGGPVPVQRVLDRDFERALRKRLGQMGRQDGQAVVTRWAKDDLPHGEAGGEEAAVQEILALLAAREQILARYHELRPRLAEVTSSHDTFQRTGERNQAMTTLLARAHQADAVLEASGNETGYDEQAAVRDSGFLRDLELLLNHIAEISDERDPTVAFDVAQLPVTREPWGEENIGHLPGLKARLDSPVRDTVFGAIGDLRGTDDEEARQEGLGQAPVEQNAPLKGAFLYRHIRDNRRALLDLVQQVGPSVAIFSLERGGSFLADLISDFRDRLQADPIPNVKVPKSSGTKLGVYSRDRHQLALVQQMMDVEEGQVFRLMQRHGFRDRPPVVTLAITETAISGSSVQTLLKTLETYHNLLPASRFQLLVEKQTIKEDRLTRGTTGGLRLTDPGILPASRSADSLAKVRMFVAQTEYILGEDVGYQISYDGRLAGQPLIVFDEDSRRLVAARLSAAGMLPRDLLRLILAGAFDEALATIFA